ncbi:pantoate--beta-alanine ligase [Bacteroidia bacterium]|nr:pantoate--beta-alanine ligase [Bacteroidia bacterium]
MKLFYSTRKLVSWRKSESGSVGFVPTMGALHDGHLALMRESMQNNDFTIVSIFVNPKQFNKQEDFDNYPNTLKTDLQKLQEIGVSAVFVPTMEEVYPTEDTYKTANPGAFAIGFEGDFRPGHFEGVVNVVDRLFYWTKPNQVYFGQKDLQQCLVISDLIKRKYKDIRFNWIPTERESDGLAMSSRNKRLSENGKRIGQQIYANLFKCAEQEGVKAALDNCRISIVSSGIDVEYLDIIYWNDMPVEPKTGRAIVFAGYLEGVRLIDNIIL